MSSIRIHALLKLICACRADGGRVCGRSAEYERPEAEDALRAARADGWTFRMKVARCPQCGREGASFPKGMP